MDDQAQLDAAPGAIDAAPVPDAEPDARVCDAECQLAGTIPWKIEYTHADGVSGRVTYEMGEELETPVLAFRFDEANGSFEHRQGGACLPVQDNPDFIRINIRALDGDIESCTFQSSWDAEPGDCPGVMVTAANGPDGQDIVLSTDLRETNPDNLCEFTAEDHFPFETSAWFEVRFTTTSGVTTKRVNLYKARL